MNYSKYILHPIDGYRVAPRYKIDNTNMYISEHLTQQYHHQHNRNNKYLSISIQRQHANTPTPNIASSTRPHNPKNDLI